MMKTAKLFRGAAAALLMGGALGAYAQEALPLVNTVSLNLAEVKNLSISYADDEVILRESETAELIIQEYMKSDRARYYANVSRSGESLSIKRGRRPWFGWNWKVRVEISLPRSFRENLRLSIASGTFRSEMDLAEYKTIDVSASSGSMSYKRLSAETVSVRLASGSLDIEGIEGASFVSASSGRLRIGSLSGGEHRIKTASGRIRIGPVQGDSTIEISSGGLDIEGLEGNAAIEVHSGKLEIGELAGISHRIRTSSGQARIEQVRGILDIDALSGSIDIGDFYGAGSVRASSGDIALNVRELTGDLRFTVSSGDIQASLPRTSAFTLDAVTNGGRVVVYDGGSELIRVSGHSTAFRPVGTSPERTIYARTASGNVRIDVRN
jgi:DUF4097 and DUF4098 domain-containing protein YvlB